MLICFSLKTYLPILVIYYYILKFDVTYMDFKSAINKIYQSIYKDAGLRMVDLDKLIVSLKLSWMNRIVKCENNRLSKTSRKIILPQYINFRNWEQIDLKSLFRKQGAHSRMKFLYHGQNSLKILT